MPHAIIPFLPAIAGAVGGLVSGRPKTTTTQQNRAYRDPMQAAIQQQLAEILKNALDSPGKAPQWMINQGKKQVNSSYNNALPNIERTLAKRGFETSGKLGGAARDVEMGRATAMQDLRAQLSQFADQRFQQMLQYAMGFQKPEGSDSTSTYTGPSPTGPILQGLGGDLSTLLLAKGGGGGGGGGDKAGMLSGGPPSSMISKSSAPTIPGAMPSMDVPVFAKSEGMPSIGKSATDTYAPTQPLADYKLPPLDEVWNQIFGPSSYKPMWRPEPTGGGAYA